MTCPTCGSDKIGPPFFASGGYELVRCGDCGLAFVANPPSEEELERLYSFANGYHLPFRDDDGEIALRFRFAERQLAAVSRHRTPPGRCLDIGASAGFFVKTASDHGWDAEGIELSKDTSALARERYGADVKAARLEDTNFEPGSFDVVTLWDVIEHVPDPLDTMRRVSELVKPGGVVGLITPNLDGLFSRRSYRVGRRLNHWPAVEPPLHLFQFSVQSLTALLDRVGLQTLEVKHEQVPLAHLFGTPRRLLKPKIAAYTAAFAPFMLIGPLIGAGDQLLVIAGRPQHPQ
jgi:SAM-dependent methyltransferase